MEILSQFMFEALRLDPNIKEPPLQGATDTLRHLSKNAYCFDVIHSTLAVPPLPAVLSNANGGIMHNGTFYTDNEKICSLDLPTTPYQY